MGSELVPAQRIRNWAAVAISAFSFPIVERAGTAAVFAAEVFFFGTIRNEHTRRAYLRIIRQFLTWDNGRSLD